MKDFSVTSPQCLSGEAFLPGDKSISHRAVMIASISDGSVEVNHFLRSDDCLRTVECMRSLGIDVKEEEDRLIVKGKGLNGLKRPKDILYVGNSGTSIRLLLGILAGQGFRSTITGDESIKRRPMTRVVKPLSLMGAKLKGRQG